MPRILVIRGGAVGDFILTLPAIQLLKQGLPQTPHVEILGYESIARLAIQLGAADAVRDIEYGPLSGFFIPNSILDPDLQSYFADFDMVLSYLYDPDGHFQGNLERSGVKTLITGSHRVDEDQGLPAALHFAKPLEQIALYLEQPFVSFQATATPQPTIAIHPGSGSPRKNWGYENWAEVASALGQSHPRHRLLIITGEAETETIDSFLELLDKRGVSYDRAHSLPLTELAERLAACQLFLGHDSGVSHLAAACGTPCVLVFGPTNPNVWAPQNPGVSALRHATGRLDQVSSAELVERCRELL